MKVSPVPVIIAFVMLTLLSGCTGQNAQVTSDNPIPSSSPEDIEDLNNYTSPVESMIDSLKRQGVDDENITRILEEQGYGWFPETGACWVGTQPTEDQQNVIDQIRGPDYSPFPYRTNTSRTEPCSCKVLIIENVSEGGDPVIINHTDKREIVMNLELYGYDALSPVDSSFENNPLLDRAFQAGWEGLQLTAEEADYALVHYNHHYFEHDGYYYAVAVGEHSPCSLSAEVCYPDETGFYEFTADDAVSVALSDENITRSINGLEYDIAGICITDMKGEMVYQIIIQKYKDDFPYGSVIPYVNLSGDIVLTGHSYPPPRPLGLVDSGL